MRKDVAHSDDTLLCKAFPELVHRLLDFLKSPPSSVLVTAPPGTGLTTLVTLLIRERGMSLIRFTSAETRLKGTLDTANVTSVGVDFKIKCIVLDEFDAMMTDALSIADVTSFLAKPVRVHVICAGRPLPPSRTKGAIAKLPSVHFPKPPLSIVANILRESGVDMPSELTSDLRGHLVEADLALKFKRDDFRDVTQTLQECAKAPTAQACVTAFSKDGNVMTSIIRENYHLMTDDLQAVVDISECFSKADVLERKTFRLDCTDALGAIMIGSPLVHLASSTRSWLDKKHGKTWSNMNHMAAKKKEFVFLRSKLRNMITIEDAAFFRAIHKAHVDAGRLDLIDEDPEIVTAICRLWSSKWYKQHLNAKLKKMSESSSKQCEKSVGRSTSNGRPRNDSLDRFTNHTAALAADRDQS